MVGVVAACAVAVSGCGAPAFVGAGAFGPNGPNGLTVLALGDSVTSGAQCSCTPFPEQLAQLLGAREQVGVDAVNLGVNGLTSTDLVAQVGEPPTRRAAAAADVVVVTVGANDLLPAQDRWDQSPASTAQEPSCGGGDDQARVDQVGADVGAVLGQVDALRSGRPTRVLVTGYWNVFEDGDVATAGRGPAYLRWSDGLTRCLNARLRSTARAHGATYVDLYAPFKGTGDSDPTGLLADDGDHPDAAGHAIIARALLDALPSMVRR